jgi:hypothetical protein
MDGFIPDLLAKAAVRLDGECADWKGLRDDIYSAITVKGDVSELYKAFGTHWLKSGKEADRVSEIKNRIQWDYLPLKDQLASVEKTNGLWALADKQRNKLIATVAEKQFKDVFHNLLNKAIFASANDDAGIRESATKTLEYIAASVEPSLFSKEAEDSLVHALIEDFSRETDPLVMSANLRCLRHLITGYIARNNFAQATDLLTKLEACCHPGPTTPPGRLQQLANLKCRLSQRAYIEPMMQSYFELGLNFYKSTALPWLKVLGASAVEVLMEMLSEETDRRRRGQIMESIRSYGNDILPELVKYLESDKWYLVRNTLILIAEMANSSCYSGVVNCLHHHDTRVKKAAARTLWRGFGKQATEPFLSVFHEVEPEIFEEILFGLAQIPAQEAVPVVLDYAVDTNHPDRLRALALNVLVTNPTHESLPILVEFVKRKGRIITTSESPEIRFAAAKAMVALGQDGKEKLLEIVKSEPAGAERDELRKILGISGGSN